MSLHLIQAILFSLWAMIMLRMFRRAHKLHLAVAMKKRKNQLPKPLQPDQPMAIRIRPAHS